MAVALTAGALAGSAHAADRVYWANEVGNTAISFARLDNTGGGGDLNTTGATVSNPDFPLLLEAPRNLKAPAIKGGSAPGSKLSCSHGSWGADLIESFLYRAPHSFAFHWSRDGKDIPGATGSSFTAKTPGVYRCRVTATNIAGSTPKTSRPHVVKASPSLLSPSPPSTIAATIRTSCGAGIARSTTMTMTTRMCGTLRRFGSALGDVIH